MSEAIELHKGQSITVRDFGAAELTKLTTEFIAMSSLLGVKELSAIEAIAIADFVKDQFSTLSFEEIRNAFKMNIAGRLPDNKGDKTKPFGSFNIDYVGTVLSLYREFKKSELRKVNKSPDLPKKGFCQKYLDENSLMNDVFIELNNVFLDRGISINNVRHTYFGASVNVVPELKNIKLNYSMGIKFFGCLDYFGIIPKHSTQVSKELWEQSKEIKLKELSFEFNRESILLSNLIRNPNLTVYDEVRNKAKIALTNIYKGLIVKRFLNDSREYFSNLYDAREELLKMKNDK